MTEVAYKVPGAILIEREHVVPLDHANPACEKCHGLKGDGKGTLATQFQPVPRNFTCAEMLDEIPDGQMFWIIRNGSPDTAMPAYKKLSDRSIWRIILYLRTLGKAK